MIHRFDGSRWLPGAAHRDGPRPFPARAQRGDFFNDVTGAIGPSTDAVAETLSDLLMKQGVFSELLPVPFDWPRLATDIQVFWSLHLNEEGLPRLMAEAVVQRDESLHVLARDPWPQTLADRAVHLAMAFVCANGQFDYIRRQSWFNAGHHQIVLKVESVVGRETDRLIWHKDTEGRALFSNLLFFNAAGLPATEWSLDLEPMPPDKRALVASQWPPGLLRELDEARARLLARTSTVPPIEGGVLGPNGYVSWVDELVWHSSPVLQHRERWTLDDAIDGLFGVTFNLATYDLMVQLACTPGGRFARWLQDQHMPLERLSYEQAEAVWQAAHAIGPKGDVWQRMNHDVRAMDWSQRPIDTGVGMGLIQDRPDSDDQDIRHQPSGMLGRPRRNSEIMSSLTNDAMSLQDRHFMQVIVAVRPQT